MAVIKASSSKAPIARVINYVRQTEKTDEKLLSGIECDPEMATYQMLSTKLLYQKTEGRSYKHYIQSFAPGENITPEKAHKIAKELAKQIPAWKGHEILIATHVDRAHIHTHFIVNSVNAYDGYKLQWSKRDLADMKERSDNLCLENGLSICEKGRTFEGKKREDGTVYEKNTYQLLEKASIGEADSYVQRIALSVMDCREQAESRQEFIDQMESRGIAVQWSDNRKNITFTDLARQQSGEKKCKIRNSTLEKYYKVDFSKGALENEFAENKRRAAEIGIQAREQLNRHRGRADRNHRKIRR